VAKTAARGAAAVRRVVRAVRKVVRAVRMGGEETVAGMGQLSNEGVVGFHSCIGTHRTTRSPCSSL
jgi:hypothetical protein